jgi:hypothetical protein
MNDELQLIERLEGIRRIIHNNTDLADVILLGMIEEAEQKVARFEAEAEKTFDGIQEELAYYGS